MKNAILILFILTFSITSHAAGVSYQDFSKLVKIFHKEYDLELKNQQAVMLVNNLSTPSAEPDMWFNMDVVRAAYSSYTENGIRNHYLFLLGGYARMEGMTIEGLAITLCHELGHGIGGTPFKDRTDNYLVSVEGQADYFATRYCLKRILKSLPITKTVAALDGYVDEKCKAAFKNSEDLKMCYRSFMALESERLYFRNQEINPSETYYDRPDQNVVSKINTTFDFYPNNQCRLDTMVNGVLGLNRPTCW